MLDTRSMQFPQVEYQEAKCTYEEHNHQKSIGGACHHIESKGEQYGHVIHLELMNLLEPAFYNGVFF